MPATKSPATTPATTIPSYPNSTKGLESLVKEMLNLEKGGNQQELAEYVKSLSLPNADDWFKSVFGDKLGARAAGSSTLLRSSAAAWIPNLLATQLDKKQTTVQVVRFEGSCNGDATDLEYPILLLRRRPEPLYDVRFMGASTSSVWRYFAYLDGGFRLVGASQRESFVEPPQSNKPPGAASPQRIQIGGTVQQAKATYHPAPVYPPEAKAEHIQGTVILQAIIGTDGSIQDLELIQGQCYLAESALDGVKRWRYLPTLFNGKPVEVRTTIQVVYALGR
jgi:TonB family protein